MISYELAITAVAERADLFAESLASILDNVDQKPERIIVHEDVRGGTLGEVFRRKLRSPASEIHHALVRYGVAFCHREIWPAAGLGEAMRWCLVRARTPIVLYAQEDAAAVRRIPVSEALAVMSEHALDHVRFNYRTTLPSKHSDKGRNPNAWKKVEVQIGGKTLCVSDHWYTMLSLWRVAPALECAGG